MRSWSAAFATVLLLVWVHGTASQVSAASDDDVTAEFCRDLADRWLADSLVTGVELAGARACRDAGLPGPYGDPTETDVEPTLPEENSSLQIKAGRPVYEPPDSADDDDEGRTEGTCNDTWLTGTLERFEDAYDMLQQMDEDLANNRPNPRTLRADSRVMRDFSNDQLESRPPASAVRANVTASLLFDRWASMLEALADWASGNSDWITGNPNAEADFWRHRDAAVELEDRLTQDMTLVESGCN